MSIGGTFTPFTTSHPELRPLKHDIVPPFFRPGSQARFDSREKRFLRACSRLAPGQTTAFNASATRCWHLFVAGAPWQDKTNCRPSALSDRLFSSNHHDHPLHTCLWPCQLVLDPPPSHGASRRYNEHPGTVSDIDATPRHSPHRRRYVEDRLQRPLGRRAWCVPLCQPAPCPRLTSSSPHCRRRRRHSSPLAATGTTKVQVERQCSLPPPPST